MARGNHAVHHLGSWVVHVPEWLPWQLFATYLNGCMDWKGNLGDVDVLLEVEQPHFQLVDLLLHRWHHLDDDISIRL